LPLDAWLTFATKWLDIISSIGKQRVPLFMSLYRRLFRADQQDHWPSSPHGGHVQNLYMDALTGCPDGVMYALAEIANLAHWKMRHVQHHSLSMRELLQRGDEIEQDLRASWVTASPEVFPHLLDQQFDINAPPSAGTASSSAHASPVHPTVDLVGANSVLSTPEPVIGAETRRLVSNVFFEATVLLLQSVINDHNPRASASAMPCTLLRHY
jgi:C6 transcription factor Pro1